ncbi:glycosyltransferase family 4 protein [Plantibacter flavus]|uniref:glycosyltransferase family 4 protein n=1 Tax=Plantibacter flavus TaxID=150123 RepID=UPI003F16E236
MSKPRLLVLASTWPAVPEDGTPSFVRDLALQEATEFDVSVLVPRVPGSLAVEQDGPLRVGRYRFFVKRWEDLADGAILENLRERRSRWLQLPFFVLGQLVATRRAVRTLRPDVIHVHWIVPQGIVARIVAPRVPKLLTSPGGDIYALDAAPMRAVKRWVLGNADHVTVMNRDMGRRAIELGTAPEDVEVLPMGTKIMLQPSPGKPVEHPSAAGPAPLRVFFIGRLVEKKGVHVLLDALRRLPSELSWDAAIGGDGPLRAELEAQAAELPVRFLGQLGRDELTAAFHAADIVVFPSVLSASGDQDGLPVALLDALAAGTTIIASALPGLDEAVVDGESGILVPSGDVDALAEAMQRVLGDASLRTELASNARLRAQDYSIESAGERYSALLLRILERRRGAQSP